MPPSSIPKAARRSQPFLPKSRHYNVNRRLQAVRTENFVKFFLLKFLIAVLFKVWHKAKSVEVFMRHIPFKVLNISYTYNT